MDQDVVVMYGKREDVLEAAPQFAAAVDGKPATKVVQPQ
jgi:hypothetical protein